MEIPYLVELIDAHKRAYGVSEAELARRIGISRQNLHLWRTRGLRGLPTRTTLDGMATELRLPYARVLEAALRDVGYLDTTDGLSGVLARPPLTPSVRRPRLRGRAPPPTSSET